MSLLKPAVNQTAFLKAGILGFAGSGKTFTAKALAIGLASLLHAKGVKRPVAFFDTETGSDFLIPAFKEARVELLVAKSRSFADLKQFMVEAQDVASVAIIDSVTHVWVDLVNSYRAKLRRTKGLQFQDWGPIKEEWGQFTNAYINASCHAILCGRAGYEYDTQTDDESGRKELVKTGTKMKAEGEMSYEPSLLLEMESVREDATLVKGQRGAIIHRCYVLKDRTDLMNGATIDNPTFLSFAPIIGFLNLGGEHVGVAPAQTSTQDLFESPDGSFEQKKQREITLELVKDALIEGQIAGTGKVEKEAQVRELKRAFGISSWRAIEEMRVVDIKAGLRALRLSLKLEVAPLPGEALVAAFAAELSEADKKKVAGSITPPEPAADDELRRPGQSE